MKATDLKGEELKREVEDLYKDIGKRISDIEKAGYTLEKDARRLYRNLEDKLPDNFDDLSEAQLKSVYRQLKYIDDLKTSTLEGAEQANVMYKDIEEIVEGFGPNIQKKFWKVYDKLYSENPNAALLYKYDILNELATVAHKSKSKGKSLEEAEESLSKILEKISGDTDYSFQELLEKEKNKSFNIDDLDYRDRVFLDNFSGTW